MAKRKVVKLTEGKAQRKRITLALRAPDAGAVYLMGDFNQWNQKMHSMKQEADGTWKKTIMVKPGRYEYRFVVDGEWRNDPSNDQICPNCYGTQNNLLEVSV